MAEKPINTDLDVWMEVTELWQIMRYNFGKHEAKLKAAKHLEDFIAVKVAKLIQEKRGEMNYEEAIKKLVAVESILARVRDWSVEEIGERADEACGIVEQVSDMLRAASEN